LRDPYADEGPANAICNGPKILVARTMGRKRQRFDIYRGARFTCDRATGRGAGALRVG